MYKLTVFQPAYREPLWPAYIDSIAKSCSKYEHEVVFVGPNPPTFDMPAHCKFILDYGCPARCSNIAVQNSTGDLVLLGADDGTFLPGLLDELLEFYDANYQSEKTIVPIRYGEAETYMAEDYWRMYYHPTLRLPGVPPHAIMFLNYLGKREYWLGMGGYDCGFFQTCNFGGHDLTVRLYNDNAHIVGFPKHMMMCTWIPGTKEHAPVRESEKFDYQVFHHLYSIPQPARSRIDINNWTTAPEVWPFAKLRA